MRIYRSRNRITVEFSYDADLVDDIKAFARAHAVRKPYDPGDKVWRFPLDMAGVVANHLGSMWEMDDFVGDAFDVVQYTQNIKDAVCREWVGKDRPPITTPDGRTLFVHQMEAVRKLVTGNRVVAHDMGLGKTLTSLVAAKFFIETLTGNIRIVCVVPPNVAWQWEEEAASMEISQYCDVISWGKVKMMRELVTSYIVPFIVIADEAHRMQTLKSQRTQAILGAVRVPRCIGCWPLTGTPMRSGRPINLFPLLRSIDHPVSYNKTQYEIRYCDAKETKFTKWDTSGSSNLAELRQRTRQHVLRRRKSECVDLPEKIRVVHHCELTKDQRQLYYEEFRRIYSEFLDRVDELEKEEDKDRMMRSAAVVSLNAVRQAASIVKCDETIEIAQDAMEEGNQVVVFTAYVESCQCIAAALGVRPYHASVSQMKRDSIVRDFVDGDDLAFVATGDSGGFGLNLQCANTVIAHDRPWAPGDIDQWEDRCHRIGTCWPVTSYWMQAFKVDETVDGVLLSKQGNIEEAIEGIKLHPWKLLEAAMAEVEEGG